MKLQEHKPQVVWFKRDLRVHDHEPLSEAAKQGNPLCLYIYEPRWFEASEFDAQHLRAVNDSLEDLARDLEQMGGRLNILVGDPVEIFDRLHRTLGISGIWSHEETGLAWSYARDRQVADWARDARVDWREFRQHGVYRPLATRDGWSRLWTKHMEGSLIPVPQRIDFAPPTASAGILAPGALGVRETERPETLPCGRSSAEFLLESFLGYRGEGYHNGMSSPVSAFRACSRLSSALAYGNLSMREVYQASRRRIEELKATRSPTAKAWVKSLNAHAQRLRWHCHFMQKLEDEPDIEFHNMNRAYDGLREQEWNEDRFQAWAQGRTGYPMVDACMRALHKGGWINFRMRAMLVSFATHHLWLHWRRPAQHLARLFQDFEPGIHYSQVQMQAGTTGINAVRIYSPVKQVTDQDPTGLFIRRYCPELARVPAEYIAEPHKMPLMLQRRVGCRIGDAYPHPVVEHGPAYRLARQRLFAVRGSSAARAESRKVYQRHGSRRRPATRNR